MADLGKTQIYGNLDLKNNELRQVKKINEINASEIETVSGAQEKVNAHINDKNNPHEVSKADVGLGSVDNYSRAHYDGRYSASGHAHGWSEITGKPSTFTPSAHSHAATEITSGTLETARLPASALVGDTTYSAGTGLSLSGTTFNVDSVFNPSGSYSGLRAQSTTKADVGLGSVDDYSRSYYDGRYLQTGARNNISVLSSITEALLNLNATNNAGSNATLLEGSIGSNTSDRYFMTFKGTSDVVNWQVSTDGVLRQGEVPWTRLSSIPSTFTPSSHTHNPGDINTSSTNRFVTDAEKSTWDSKADGTHSHTIADITNLSAELDGKADTGHAHAWSEITSKPTTFTPSSHTHAATEITSGTLSTDRLPASSLIGDTTYTAGTGLSLSGTTFNIQSVFDPSGSYAGLRAQATTKTDVGLGNVINENFKDYGLGVTDFATSELDYATNASSLGAGFYSVTDTEAAIIGSTSNGNSISFGINRADGNPASVYVNHTWSNAWSGKTELWHESNFNPDTKSNTGHGHSISDVSNLQSSLDSKAPSSHTHNPGDINTSATNRFVTDTEKSTWNSKADGNHDHAWADITNKPTTFTPSSHTHAATEITSGTISADRLPASALVGDTTYAAGTGLSLSGTTFSVDNVFNPSGSYTGLRAQSTTKEDVGLGSVDNLSASAIRGGTTKADVGLGDVDNYSRAHYDGRYAGIAHISSNGSDHSFINQDVTTGASPTFRHLTLDSGGSPEIAFDLGGTGTTGDYRIYSWGSSRTLTFESMGDVSVVIDHNNNQTGKAFRVLHDGEGSSGSELFKVADNGDVSANTFVENNVALSGKYASIGTAISSGTGLTGGGTLTDNRTLSLDTSYTDNRYAASSHTHSQYATGDDFNATGSYTGLRAQATTKTDVGLGNVDDLSASAIRSGTTKANVGLGNVDNYSRAHYDSRYAGIAHQSSDGTDHSFINQSVTTTASPTFSNVNVGQNLEVSGTSKADSFKTSNWEFREDATNQSLKIVFTG